MRFFRICKFGLTGALSLLATTLHARAVTVADASSPSLSPDGKSMVFVRRTEEGNRLFISDLNGVGATPIGRPNGGRGDDLEPNWRADGQLIVFASNRGGNFDLYTIKADGSGLRQITRTPFDERDPQWSPRPFGLRAGDSGKFVPQRSLKGLTPSDLQLLQLLAESKNAAATYEKSSDVGGYFDGDARPLQRYYKLLCAEGKPGAEQLGVMREDGTLHLRATTGMPGAHLRPRWGRAARDILFMRKMGTQGTLYLAAAPSVTEFEAEDKPKDPYQTIVVGKEKHLMGIDLGLWRGSIKRMATIPSNTALNWTPNGEFAAVAQGSALRLIPRRDRMATASKDIVTPVRGTVTGTSLSWGRDARTAFFTVNGAAGSAVNSARLSDALLDVTNWLDFTLSPEDNALTAPDRAMLARQGFAAAGDGRKQMYQIYEQTDYSDLPVFVTSDSLLHLNHLVFDYVYRSVESDRLLPEVIALVRTYLAASIQQAKSAPNPQLKNAALANAAFFAVAARLVKGEIKTGMPDSVPAPIASEGSLMEDFNAKMAAARQKRVAALNTLTAPLDSLLEQLPSLSRITADQEMVLINEHKERATSPIFGGALSQPAVGEPIYDTRMDYTDFVPRGHYTRTETLRRYFLLSHWLSGAPFRPSESGIRQTLLLTSATNAESAARLKRVMTVIGNFVGGADDHTPLQYLDLAHQTFGDTFSMADFGDAAKVATFAQGVMALPGPRIAASAGVAMRFLPQPYTFDAEMMQNLVYDTIPPDVGTDNQPRYFALGLDVMGVLGSDRARTILDNTKFQGTFFDFDLRETEYANYDAQFRAERAKIAAMQDEDWSRNLYNRTFYAMLPLLKPDSLSQFRFTQIPAWKDKQLNTALATWAELKHDTMPKQPVAIEAGGDSGLSESVLIDQPQGFVEPTPEVYRRLSALVTAERDILSGAGYLTPALGQRLKTLTAVLDMVTRLEAKQRAGKAWTPGEIEQLRFFGVFLEHLTLATIQGQSESIEDNDMALIADVSSAYSTRLKKQLVLEEGVGHALPLYVAVERNGTRTLACGAIFTYYEFTYPAADRLTDLKWQQYLSQLDRPQTPNWTKSFIATHREQG